MVNDFNNIKMINLEGLDIIDVIDVFYLNLIFDIFVNIVDNFNIPKIILFNKLL
jgi:hypothetical protein